MLTEELEIEDRANTNAGEIDFIEAAIAAVETGVRPKNQAKLCIEAGREVAEFDYIVNLLKRRKAACETLAADEKAGLVDLIAKRDDARVRFASVSPGDSTMATALFRQRDEADAEYSAAAHRIRDQRARASQLLWSTQQPSDEAEFNTLSTITTKTGNEYYHLHVKLEQLQNSRLHRRENREDIAETSKDLERAKRKRDEALARFVAFQANELRDWRRMDFSL